MAVARRVQERAVSAVEVTRAALARLERLNPTLNAFITVTADEALANAPDSYDGAFRVPAVGG